MRPILSATGAMLAELKLAPQDWDSFIPSIASALNEAGLERLGRRYNGITRSPLELMTVILPNRGILRVLPKNSCFEDSKSITHARATEILSSRDLQESLNNVHKDVTRSVTDRREKSIHAHNWATNIVAPSFSVGDFVLVRRANDRGHKLRFRWYGPYRITTVHSPLVYTVKSLQGDKEPVNCVRLLKYRDSLMGEAVPKEMMDLAERTESRYEVVDSIKEIGEAHDGLFFQVMWDGHPDKRDWTWQSVTELYADISSIVLDFLKTYSQKKRIKAKIMRQLKLT